MCLQNLQGTGAPVLELVLNWLFGSLVSTALLLTLLLALFLGVVDVVGILVVVLRLWLFVHGSYHRLSESVHSHDVHGTAIKKLVSVLYCVPVPYLL